MAKAKILVVEDQLEILRATTKCLQSGGYDVVPARDGVSGTQLAVEEQPDVILLDIGLPAGDGHTVAERLQANVKTMSIPVIYLTSHKSDHHVRKAEELGAVGYLVKPHRPETLLNMIGEVIRKRTPVTRN